MKDLFLLKIGELALKGKNKKFFVNTLVRNIKKSLEEASPSIVAREGRFYVRTNPDFRSTVEDRLSKTCGIVGFSRAFEVDKDFEAIKEKALEVAEEMPEGTVTFKVNPRRTDKSFPMSSYELGRDIGAAIWENNNSLKVQMKNPDWVLNIEIREKAYIYASERKSPGGLPTLTSGRGILLLSGGIDSPVAGYMMMKRGLKLDAIYFSTPPYTSEEATQKVKDLAEAIAPWNVGLNLFIIPFTDIQLYIRKNIPVAETTLHTRAAMTQMAAKLAHRRGAGALVTGESLGQVASQTIESLRFTNSAPDLPVFRPLIGLDKEMTIDIARKIGTYETSIQPFEDCCTLFSPPNPVTRPEFEEIRRNFDKLEMEELFEEALDKAERVYFP